MREFTQTTSLPLELKSLLSKIDPNENKILRHYQLVVWKFLKEYKTRGLLIYHEMGYGKSIIMAALIHLYFDSKKRIIVMTNKSLQGNFEKNLHKYFDKQSISVEDVLGRIQFVSMNAGNMFEQLFRPKKADKTKLLSGIDDSLSINNTIFIIDEAHNLFNSITNGSQNALKFYNNVMETKDTKLFFLTGTPIVNHPFELIPCFNMLRGKMSKNGRDYFLFPEEYNEFLQFFVDEELNVAKNVSKFRNRMFGMVSYFGTKYEKGKRDGFPTKKPLKVEIVHMSKSQYDSYWSARELEIMENAVSVSQKGQKFVKKSYGYSSYRVKSRQISNYLIPNYAVEIKDKKVTKYINKITEKDLLNLDKYSPKIKKLLQNMKLWPNKLGVIYSSFVTSEGIGIIERILTLKKIKYATITGQIPFEEREKIMNEFNSPENRKCEKIQILLISSTGAEGLDLKGVRHIHILEPYWNYSRIRQIEARAVRYLSHAHLPKSEQFVQPYIYLSNYPKYILKTIGGDIMKIHDVSDAKERKLEKLTTDMELFSASIANNRIAEQFLNIIVTGSIDCLVHKESLKLNIPCQQCLPDGKPLYAINFDEDRLLPNVCKPLKTQKIKTKVVEVDKKKYYYVESGGGNYEIYEYRDDVGQYIRIGPDHEDFASIMHKID